MNRFYIDTMGNDDDAYREAIQFACRLAEQYPETTRVILYIGQKGSDGWFERLFGGKVVKQLYMGMRFDDCRLPFKFETVRTYTDQYDRQQDIVIACGRDADDLYRIDDYYSVHSIIAIPWLKENTQAWLNTWNPTNIRNGEVENEVDELPCIIQKAMNHLSETINMATGIRHDADKELAKTYILALHNNGNAMSPETVRDYLVRERNWSTEHAQDVFDLIAILNSGRYFHGGNRDNASWDYHINRWNEECADMLEN